MTANAKAPQACLNILAGTDGLAEQATLNILVDDFPDGIGSAISDRPDRSETAEIVADGVEGLRGSNYRLPSARFDIPVNSIALYTPLEKRHIVTTNNIYGSGSPSPMDSRTFYVKKGFHPRPLISQRFLRYDSIASVAWYCNDASLASGSVTPSVSAVSTQTVGPFPAGGFDSNLHALECDLSSFITNYSVRNWLSALVTFIDGSKEVQTIDFYPYSTAASFSSYLATTAGTTGQVPRGVYSLTSDSTSRASQTVVEASAGEVILVGTNSLLGSAGVTTSASTTFTDASGPFVSGDSTKVLEIPGYVAPGTTVTYVNATTLTLSVAALASGSSLAYNLRRGTSVSLSTGSKLTFKGDFRFIGGFIFRGDDYQIVRGKTGTPHMVFPHWLEGLTETNNRILSLDGVSGSCDRPYIEGVRIGRTMSDAVWNDRCTDVHMKDLLVERPWELYGAAHFDAYQNAGSITASGNLKDSDGEAVAVLLENCHFQGNALIKPDTAAMGKITMENTTFRYSGRVGIQVWNHATSQSDSNTIDQAKFKNVWSWGHVNLDYQSLATGTGALATVVESGSGLHYGTPATDSGLDIPADFLSEARPIIMGDARSNTGTGTTWSVNFPGVHGADDLVVVFLRVTDQTKTSTADTISPLTQRLDTAPVDSLSSRLYVYTTTYDGVTSPTLSGTFSGSTEWRASAVVMSGADITNPVHVIRGVSGGAQSGGVVATANVTTTATGRMLIHYGAMTAVSGTGTWNTPTDWATQIAAAATAQVSNSAGGQTRWSNSTTGDLLAYWPYSEDMPKGQQGALSLLYTLGGNAAGCTIAINPREELPAPRITVAGLTADEILSEVVGLTTKTVAGQLRELREQIQVASSSAIARPASGSFVTPVTAGRTTGLGFASGEMYLIPIDIATGISIDRIGSDVSVVGIGSGQVIRFGIYGDDGTKTKPSGAPLFDAGTIDATSGTGDRLITITQYLPVGRWWLACAFQGTLTTPVTTVIGTYVSQIGSTDLSSTDKPGWKQTSVTSTLPSIGTLARTGGVPLMGVRVV